ncbi:MAG: hypothetical protein R2698_11265 [Microthrixaceae bacterium]
MIGAPLLRKAAGYAGAAVVVWLAALAFAPNGAPIGAVLQGMVLGSATALTAVGLVLIWRANRFINFAQLALGAAVGLGGVQTFIAWHWPWVLSLLAGTAAGVAVGALTEALVIRRFQRSTRLVLTVASLGLAQLLGGVELAVGRYGFGLQGIILDAFPTPLSARSTTITAIRFDGNHLLIVAAVPLLAGMLALLFTRTAAGIGIRAAAENAERALLLGIPVRRLHTLVWAIAGGWRR